MTQREGTRGINRPSPVACNDACSKLASILPILEAFNHRHRNQHSASHWWKAFNILRRQLRKLCETLHLAIGYQGRKQERHLAMVSAQSQHIAHVVIPQSYPAITQLAADNQHAALGIALMAAIAGVHSALVGLLPEEETAGADTTKQKINTEMRPAESSNDGDKGVTISRSQFTTAHEVAPDRKRKATSTLVAAEDKTASTQAIGSKEKDKSSRKKKKPKKGGDAFSSLFGSL
ncbi:hypothetical protein VHEMI04470 [[Torrubiella] hemipterigena]|uniref:RNase MRP protein 1 RNA binding domain-containing protein n=1 Tax=[Torrubiella] hemipterigena TaxID=1531966 RepID=A0A0A1SVC1_9HYPO|nr:hypothetical protein VHEMI04470 [[Torrubiella] hemipterigena]